MSSRKVLIFGSYALWRDPLDTDLELILKHRAEGDDVHVMLCRGELFSCDANPDHLGFHCGRCRDTSGRALTVAGVPEDHCHPLAIREIVRADAIPDFETLDQLRAYQWNGVPVGIQVASSLISRWREPHPDLRRNGPSIKRSIAVFLGVYQACLEKLRTLSPDVFYLANGRGFVFGAALEAAQKSGVAFGVHERPTASTYSLAENYSPYRLKAIQQKLKTFSEGTDCSDTLVEQAARWFRENRSGKNVPHWVSGIFRYRREGQLPDHFDRTRRNVAVFLSSEDEMQAFADWKNHFFANQNEGVRFLIESLRNEGFHFYIRLHPYLSGVDNSQTRGLKELNDPEVTCLPSETTIDTYALVEACEKTVTFGSTVGVEATYLGKPSVLIGRSIYEHLNIAYVPTAKKEIVALIRKRLDAKPRETALKYGAYMFQQRRPYEYVTTDGNQVRQVGKNRLQIGWWLDHYYRLQFLFFRVKRKLGTGGVSP